MQKIEKLVIASHNKGKIKEISELLKPFGVQVLGGPDFGFEEPEETAESFIGNAEIKAKYFAEKTGLPSLSDDSGMCVDILGGAPGIYSARWAEIDGKRDFDYAMKKVEEEVSRQLSVVSFQPIKAHFICALSLTYPNMKTTSFEGRVDGTLTFPPRGDHGFGYDAIFIPNGYDITFAEMNPEEKHKISHRADAFKKFVEYLSSSKN
jgi:XTP/dITP diphosphohydrolase